MILLEAGHHSMQSREKTTHLISAIANQKCDADPYHNLVLALECLRDVGGNRIEGDLQQKVQQRLRQGLEVRPSWLARRFGKVVSPWFGKGGGVSWIEQRTKAMDALVRTGGGLWTLPYGEPEWIKISAGEFWMGDAKGESNEKPLERIKLDAYQIARAPITNAQYYLFTQATGHPMPNHWQGDHPPKGLESHPVVRVTWQDALAYCQWLSSVTGKKSITLSSEAEWERAARGDKDKRRYPWGDAFEEDRCNGSALGLGTTTPVGIFPEGASPDGCLDMAGNVWEWTRSLYGKYPYPGAGDPDRRKRENLDDTEGRRVLRGGSFFSESDDLRCACRSGVSPIFQSYGGCGFRVILPGGSDAG